MWWIIFSCVSIFNAISVATTDDRCQVDNLGGQHNVAFVGVMLQVFEDSNTIQLRVLEVLRDESQILPKSFKTIDAHLPHESCRNFFHQGDTANWVGSVDESYKLVVRIYKPLSEQFFFFLLNLNNHCSK